MASSDSHRYGIFHQISRNPQRRENGIAIEQDSSRNVRRIGLRSALSISIESAESSISDRGQFQADSGSRSAGS